MRLLPICIYYVTDMVDLLSMDRLVEEVLLFYGYIEYDINYKTVVSICLL